jgi:hypothetical protein
MTFMGVNRVEMLVLLLPHSKQRKFLAWDALTGLHWPQVDGILLSIMIHLLISIIWDLIPYQHLSHDSCPLGFLTPHLVLINIYLCSLTIFVRILTTKVTESCSFKSWFMLGITVRTAMLGPHPFPPCRWLTRNSPPNPKDWQRDNY